MPVYAYHCRACDSDFDFKQSFNDEPLKVCQVCGTAGQVVRVIQPAGVVFKGSGFYVTDTRGATKPSPVGGKKEEGAASNGDSNGNGAAAASEASSSTTTPATTSTSGAAD